MTMVLDVAGLAAKQQGFNINDPANIGRPAYWSLSEHVAAVIGMIRADELEIAFTMLDQIPAWYRERENYPKELQAIKDILYRNLYDVYDYASDPDEAGWTKEDAESQFLTGYTYPRGEILNDLVAELNTRGLRPWIVEFSTSHGLLPLGLKKHGRDFTFYGKNLNHAALVKLKGWLGDTWNGVPEPTQPKVFVFTEALEHCMREEDLLFAYKKMAIDFDYIVLSVPYGCLGGGLPDWSTRRLGHVRGYAQKDFYDLALRFFGLGYEWKMYKSVSMVLVGKKHG